MTASAPQPIVNASTPRIICPRCAAQMILSRIEPEGPDNRDRMFFECVCGFEYRLSDGADTALLR